jgi:hypothetical protein
MIQIEVSCWFSSNIYFVVPFPWLHTGIGKWVMGFAILIKKKGLGVSIHIFFPEDLQHKISSSGFWF